MVLKIQRRRSDGSLEYAAVKCIRIPESEEYTQSLLSRGFSRESIRQKYRQDAEEMKKEFVFMDILKGNPNVVHCDDFSVIPLANNEPGFFLLIKMELLTPLEHVMKQSYDERQVVSLGMDICNALIACKKHNIIHRDIKPANILASGDGSVYKLGDFGVSKLQEHTASGTKTGTWAFMAPEVYNNVPYNASVDIYSLGMVLYWMMNRRCEPFLPLPPAIPTGNELQSSWIRRFNGELLPMPVDGSIALKNAVLRACDPNPQNRFDSPEEMYNALSAISEESASGAQGSYHYSYVNGSKRGSAGSGTQGPQKTRGNDWGSEGGESTGSSQGTGSQSGGTMGTESGNREGKKKNIYTSLDVKMTLKLTKEEAANGCKKIISIPDGRKVRINVPKGSDKPNTQLRLAGLGREDPATGAKGTLYVKLVMDADFWEDENKFYVNEDPFYLSPKDNKNSTVTFRMYEPIRQPIKVVIPAHSLEKDNPVSARGYIVNSEGELLNASAAPIPLKVNTILIKTPTEIQKTPDSVLKLRMSLAVPKNGFVRGFYLFMMLGCIAMGLFALSTGAVFVTLIGIFGALGCYFMAALPSEKTKQDAAEAKAELNRRYGLWVR